jgi:hypothetical protein
LVYVHQSGGHDPFGIGNNVPTIRDEIRGFGDPHNYFGGYSGGLLSSMDSTGAGFAQIIIWIGQVQMLVPPILYEWALAASDIP